MIINQQIGCMLLVLFRVIVAHTTIMVVVGHDPNLELSVFLHNKVTMSA